ncbi:hypothetical protein HYZ05_02810 [Candidatus Daviesbacteria bacterium]|nr:hypothetical protein [Candidatus Daviesbacteria bacterium]
MYGSIGSSRQLVTGKTNSASRLDEAKKASKYGGFEYSIMFQGEEFMKLDSVPQKRLIENIEDKIEAFEPDIICIPFRDSFDQDHRALFSASITALRPIPKNLRHQPKIILEAEEPYSWTNRDGFKPNFYFDISEIFKEKIELLKCHETQLREDPFPRSPQNLERMAGIRGTEIGVKYAEGYNLLKASL